MSDEYKKTDADLRSSYWLNLKRATVITLLFFNALVLVSPRIKVAVQEKDSPQIVIHVENIPVTRHSRRIPPPRKPSVPIPSDDESIPEDETIEETTLRLTDFDYSDGIPSFPGTAITPPKPIAWVFPEYPEEDKKRGVQGVVRLSIHIDRRGKVVEVVVLENTTRSDRCAQAAVEAAYNSRFLPAREGENPVSAWISQPYRFDIKK